MLEAPALLFPGRLKSPGIVGHLGTAKTIIVAQTDHIDILKNLEISSACSLALCDSYN